MARRALPVLIVVLLGLSAFHAAGCGNSGPATTDAEGVDLRPLFAGTYCAFSFQGTAVSGQTSVVTGWSTMTADAAGGVTSTGAFNDDGTVIGPVPPAPATYTVDAARTLDLVVQGVATQRGRISADGALACLGAIRSGLSPSISILGRKQGGQGNSSLQGLYHLCALFFDPVLGDTGTYFGTASFLGAGTGTATTRSNIGGTISNPATTALTYTVAGDGTVTGTLLGTFTLQGAVFEGGALVVLSGGTVFGEPPILVVLTKATAAASNALFVGDYTVVTLDEDDPPNPSWDGFVATVAADGFAGIDFQHFILNMEGVIASSPGGSPAFITVAPDGSLFTGASSDLVGGITANGKAAVLCGGTGGGDDRQLWFFLR